MCVAFPLASQPLWQAMAWDYWLNTVQDVNPSKFGDCMTALICAFPLLPGLFWGSNATGSIMNSGCVASKSHLFTSAFRHVNCSWLVNSRRFWAYFLPLPWWPSTVCLACLLFLQILSGQPLCHFFCSLVPFQVVFGQLVCPFWVHFAQRISLFFSRCQFVGQRSCPFLWGWLKVDLYFIFLQK